MVVKVLPPLGLSGFEVYETQKVKTDTTKINTDDSNSSETEEELSDSEKELQRFIAMNGEITEIAYYDNMYSNSFDEDYEGISNNGSVSFPEIDTSRFYKGKKVCLKKANETGTPLKWDDLDSCLLGFIAKITFTNNEINISLVGMSKLLDQEKQFSFTQTRRSEILKQMIEAAGLKADIKTEGLNDDVIDYTNVSSSGNSSGLAGGQGESIDNLVKGWVGGETNELNKAKLVHNGLKEYGIRYRKYNDTEYHTAENCLKHCKDPGLNCGDTSILTVACMKSAGLNAFIGFRCDHAHYFTVIKIGGKEYYSDLTWSEGQLSKREWNTVWQNNTNWCSNKGSSLG